MVLDDLRFASFVVLGACSASAPAPVPQNVTPAPPHETLPCFARDLAIGEWHRLVRADHDLVFDVVSEDKPPPGWPDGWSAGTCRVVPKYNEETTNMDFLVQQRGTTIATIGERHVDFYIRTPLPGPQPGDRVGDRAFHDCVHEYNTWKFAGNRMCTDDSSRDRAFLVHTERMEPLATDTIVARRAVMPSPPRASRVR
jgi:hypothetical protein